MSLVSDPRLGDLSLHQLTVDIDEIHVERAGVIMATTLMERCERVSHTPISELSLEDLRLMLGQDKHVDLLAPFAAYVVAETPLLEASLFPGDLLLAVLRAAARSQEQVSPKTRSLILGAAVLAQDTLAEADEDEILSELTELMVQLR